MKTKERLAFLENNLRNYDFKIEVGECSNKDNICLSFYKDDKCVMCSYCDRKLYNKLVKKLNVSPIENLEDIIIRNSDFIQAKLTSYSLVKVNKLRSNLRIHMWKNQRTRENMITAIMRTFHQNAFNHRQIISDFIKSN